MLTLKELLYIQTSVNRFELPGDADAETKHAIKQTWIVFMGLIKVYTRFPVK